MKTPKEIGSWLRANCGQDCLAPLSSTDTVALVASVHLTPLIGHEHASDELFAAYGAVVRQMQPQTRWLAFHAIAIELDWPMRFTVWELAGLPEEDKPRHKAAYEPGGAKRP
jgi:hypothetical protein